MIPLGLWPRYAAFWVPGCPPRGNPYDADCIFGLALGRNSIADKDLWTVGAEWRTHDLNDAATRQELLRQGFDPGRANAELATEAIEKSRELEIPLVLQWEIYVALPDQWLRQHPNTAFAIWPPARAVEYWNSRDVAIEALEMMSGQRGPWFSRPALIAHKWHALRGYLLVRPVLGKNLIVLPLETVSFDPNSIQAHTRSRTEWLKREWKARAHHVVFRLV